MLAPHCLARPPNAAWVPTQALDYQYRGEAFRDWPWYFYVAGVTRLRLSHTHGTSPLLHRFAPDHPLRDEWLQSLLATQAWKIPLLVGPAIPAEHHDRERRAAILLLLFRPWTAGPATALVASGGATVPYAQQLHDYLNALQAQSASLPSDCRPPTFSTTYWARRVLHTIENISNWTHRGPYPANAGVRQNPDAAAGVENTTEVHMELPLFGPLRPEDDESSNEEASVLDDLDVAAGLEHPDADLLRNQCLLQDQDIPALLQYTSAAPNRNALCSDHHRLLHLQQLHFSAPVPAPDTLDSPQLFTHPALRQLRQRARAWEHVLHEADNLAENIVNVVPQQLFQSPPAPPHIWAAAWRNIVSGRCNTRDGQLNLKQAAHHLLFAARLVAAQEFQFLRRHILVLKLLLFTFSQNSILHSRSPPVPFRPGSHYRQIFTAFSWVDLAQGRLMSSSSTNHYSNNSMVMTSVRLVRTCIRPLALLMVARCTASLACRYKTVINRPLLFGNYVLFGANDASYASMKSPWCLQPCSAGVKLQVDESDKNPIYRGVVCFWT